MQTLQRCARQTALERQDLSRTYLAHHELESDFVIIIIIITIIIMSNAGEAHLGPQAQPTGTPPPPKPPKTILAGTAQLSLEMLKRTDARTEVTEIQTVRTGTHVRRVLPDLGTGMGTGLGTGMERTDITVTGRTNSHTCMLWCSGQENCNACAVGLLVYLLAVRWLATC